MTYKNVSELPADIQDSLPEDMQAHYMQLFNSAWEQYEDDEVAENKEALVATAHQVAWEAINENYANVDGRWQKKA